MKTLLTSVLALAVVAIANPAFAGGHKDAMKKAKAECQKENPSLKGADLQKCVHEKAGK